MNSLNKEGPQTTTKILEVIKKAPLERVSTDQIKNDDADIKPDKSSVLHEDKADSLFVKKNQCRLSFNSLVLNPCVNRPEDSNIRSKTHLKEKKSLQEDVKGEENEELHESNYSSRSYLDATDKVKIAGSRIVFINSDSYI